MFLITIKPLIILFNGFLLASLYWDSSMLHVSLVHSTLLLSCIPFHGYITICLASNLWVDIWVVSVSDYYKWSCYKHSRTSPYMGIYFLFSWVEWLGCLIGVYFIFWEMTKLFSKEVVSFYILTNSV